MKKKLLASLLCSVGVLGLAMTTNQQEASAHGYVQTPASRGYQGILERDILGYQGAWDKYRAVITNPQSLEAPKGFPQGGPADGRIASAEGGGGQIGDYVLDNQSSTRWTKQDNQQGPLAVTWHYTAPHSTAKWHYYMTKPGWDPNDALDRGDFELIGEIKYDGSLANTKPTHQINIPKDRIGYHVILAVWDVADTANAFYNVIDVNVKGDSALPVTPNTPQNVKATEVTDRQVKLTWKGQTDAASYNVYRDGKKIETVKSPEFVDKTVAPETNYSYTIEAVGFNGLVSQKSQPLKVTTNSTESEEAAAPTAPKHLHSMGTTASSVSLMWGASSHASGIKEYQILRDGKVIATTSKTVFEDKELSENTEYSYTVKAVAKTGVVSKESNVLKVRTEKSETNDDTEDSSVRTWKLGSFSSPELYTAGEEVKHQGKVYKVFQTHFNYGDPTWAPNQALTLFTAK